MINQSLPTVAIIIPAYQPDIRLVQLVREIKERRPEQWVIVVDDGSNMKSQTIFTMLHDYQVVVLKHAVNQGKGQALKTAFEYYLSANGSDQLGGVVTADADGQHRVEDILAIIDAQQTTPHHLHLGVRNLAGKSVPWQSRLGNQVTGFIFRRLCQSDLRDTQTGLRGIPISVMTQMLKSKAKAYELELEMLFLAFRQQIPFVSLPISTIYINNNANSHFHPIVDSLKVYSVFVRFCGHAVLDLCRRLK